MYQEKDYYVFPTAEGGIVFAISQKENTPHLPKIFYDGGNHAILYRGEDDLIVLDFLHPQAKKIMQSVSMAHIAEVDYTDKKMVRFYSVPVHQVFKMPVDLSGLEQPK